MNAVEKVQQAAGALLAAIREAQAGGYVVQWPSRPENLPAIAISATAAVPQPLALTDEERAGLPALDVNAIDDPHQYVAVKAPRRPRK